MISITPPGFILILGALLIPLLRGRSSRSVYMLLLCGLSLVNVLHLPVNPGYGADPVRLWAMDFMGQHLILGQIDRLSLFFSYIFHLIYAITVVYSWHLEDRLQHTACAIYAGAAIGAVFAGDFFTLFLFWETLTVSATLLIWSRRTKKAQAAGFRYLMVHAVGGLILLLGIVLRHHATGSIEFSYAALKGIAALNTPSSILIFLGFGVNCAWPLLHNWLTDAYPEATITGTVALSAFTTKTAVYVLARAYAGQPLLIVIGAAMAAFPIFFAVIENDLRRVLAYSLINQVGFMVVGIGIGTELAVNGAVCHAFNDILFKGLLFMSMGAVMYRTGKINATDLGGLYKSMPLTCIFCMVGAASISAFPLFSGFVSKSMVMDAAGLGHHTVVWFLLLFASAGVFHHAGIKIPFFAFFSHDSGIRCKEAPWNMLLAMGVAAGLCIFIGSYPYPLYSLLPFPVEYTPYTAAHVVSQTQILFYSALAFSLLLLSGIYPAEMRAVNLDADWWYRKGWKPAYWIVDKVFNGVNALSARILVQGAAGGVMRFFGSAPRRLALALLAPLWLLSGATGDKFQEKKHRLYAALETSTTPVGVSAAMAAIVVFGLILSTLFLRK